MRRALLAVCPIFLVVACGSSPPPPASATAPEVPASSPSVEPTTAAAEPSPASASSSARKRRRTGPPSPPPRDGTKPKNGRTLNPKDELGRTVFVRADDHCFVEVPPRGSTLVVDCPAAADDPAYDHCAAQIVLDEGGGKCFCVDGAAHPRPMPNPTPCPKGE